jgi:DNA-binding MarR family transcriptional regulator
MKDQDFCFSLMKTSRLVTRFLDRALNSVGITASQFYMLVALSEGAKKIAGYAQELGMERSTASRSLVTLEDFWLVRREDGYSLTKSGRETIDKCKTIMEGEIDKLVNHLSGCSFTSNNLIRDLKKVEEAVSPMVKRISRKKKQ